MAKPKPHYFCEACGAQVDKWDIQCPHCGKQFDSIKCPQCGYSGHAQEFSNGCPSCGFMSEEQKAAAADRKKPNAKGRTFSLPQPKTVSKAGRIALVVFLLAVADALLYWISVLAGRP